MSGAVQDAWPSPNSCLMINLRCGRVARSKQLSSKLSSEGGRVARAKPSIPKLVFKGTPAGGPNLPRGPEPPSPSDPESNWGEKVLKMKELMDGIGDVLDGMSGDIIITVDPRLFRSVQPNRSQCPTPDCVI